MLTRLTGYKVRLVESSGTPISRLFSLDLSTGCCHRSKCAVCLLHTGKGSSKGKRKSIVYESKCQLCKHSNEGLYVGESGRSLYERAGEHLADAADQKTSSHIYKHWAISHPEEELQPVFKFSVVKQHRSPLDRQIHEAVRISTHGKLNSKSEFRQNQIKRLSVALTDRELKAVRKELEKEDEDTEQAMKALSVKLKNKSCSNAVNLLASSNFQDSAESLADSLGNSKRKAKSEPATSSVKRLRIERDSSCSNMGRSSKGNSCNESKNLYKLYKDWSLDNWLQQEKLRNDPLPTTFAEASLLAKKKRKMRESSLLTTSILVPQASFLSPQPLDTSCASPEIPAPALSDVSCSPTSPSMLPMTPIEPVQEGDLSVSLMQLQLAPTSNISYDSFSSEPDSQFNKGATAFLELLERCIAAQQAQEESVSIDNLLIQMMDLSVEKKLPNTHEISTFLNNQGWDASQVLNVWQVSSRENSASSWSFETLGELGGKDVTTRIWHRLKDLELTGNPKRCLENELPCGQRSKKRRLSQVSLHSNCISPLSKAGAANETPGAVEKKRHHSTPLTATPTEPRAQRKTRRAKKPGPISTPTLTRWLIQGNPSKEEAPATPNPSPRMTPPTDSAPRKTLHKRKRKNKKTPFPQETGPAVSRKPVDEDPSPATPLLMKTNRAKKTSHANQTSPILRPRATPELDASSASTKPNTAAEKMGGALAQK